MKKFKYILLFLYLSYFSDENKDEHSEKSSKNDDNAMPKVESSEKDENAISDSDKIKQNDDECKDVEETANDDKPGMYI